MSTHCKKFGKTDWDILRDVAEHSDPSFAKQILKRNLTALKELRTIKILNSQGPCYWSTKQVPIGCPHCNGCGNCLWTNAYCEVKKCEDASVSCLDVLFYGVSARDTCLITLSKYSMAVRVYKNMSQEDFDKAVAFLKGHIEWARKPYWGKKFIKGE